MDNIKAICGRIFKDLTGRRAVMNVWGFRLFAEDKRRYLDILEPVLAGLDCGQADINDVAEVYYAMEYIDLGSVRELGEFIEKSGLCR